MKAKKSYFIDWSDKDPYILENYDKMTIKEMAKNLGVNYGTLYYRIKILREKGLIGYKEVVKVQNPKAKIKTNILDGNLEIGRKYKIRHCSEKGNKFEGTLIDKAEKFYVFEGDWIECFLKVDFVIGEYQIKEVIL